MHRYLRLDIDWQNIDYTRGGLICSIEESFAESQKHQRAAKSVFGVNAHMVKMQVLHKAIGCN